MKFDFNKQPGLYRNNTISLPANAMMSIITPFYNAGEFFEQTFNCVMNQTFIWFEWIIVDDGSNKKEDVSLLEQLAKSDERIKVYHIRNSGPAAARNFAVSKTTTNLIVSLDADDLIEPVYLEETYFALYFNPSAAWAYTDSLGFGKEEYIWKVCFDSERLKRKNSLIEIGTFRKEIFEFVGGYDAAQKYSHEDWNLWLRFMAKGKYPVHISSLSAWYRIVDNGALHKTNDNEEVKKRAFLRIKEVADKIKSPIDAIEYPRVVKPGQYCAPKCSDWVLKKEKSMVEILAFLPNLTNNGEICLYLELLEKIGEKSFHIGVMTTEATSDALKQHFSEKFEDFFELPDFLDVNNFPEFISYYIKSRQVDIVFVYDNYYVYCMIPWLRKEFPNLRIIEWKTRKELKYPIKNNYDVIKKGIFFDKAYTINSRDGLLKLVDEFEKTSKEFIDKWGKMDWEELYAKLSDAYLMMANELSLQERIYVDFEEKVDKYYKDIAKKRVKKERIQSTKIGSLIMELINMWK